MFYEILAKEQSLRNNFRLLLFNICKLSPLIFSFLILLDLFKSKKLIKGLKFRLKGKIYEKENICEFCLVFGYLWWLC